MPTHDQAPLVWICLGIVYVVWGSTYLAIRVMVETMPPLVASGVRFTLAGAIFAAILAVRRGPRSLRVSARELGACTVMGLGLILLGNGMVAVAEEDVPSGLAALLVASVPLFVVVLRGLWGERPGRVTVVSVLVGFAGVAILVLPGDRPEDAPLGATLLVVGAALAWAGASFYAGRGAPLPRDPFTATSVQMLVGGLLATVAGLAVGEGSEIDLARFSGDSLLAFAYLVVVGSLVAFTAYVWLLQHAPISQVSTYAYVNPVIAIFLGWLILAEPITLSVAVGATVIVLSVAATVRTEHRPMREEPEAISLPGRP